MTKVVKKFCVTRLIVFIFMEFSFQDTFFVANGMWFQELKKKMYCGQTKGALSLVLQVRGILGGRGYSSFPNIDLSQELTM